MKKIYIWILLILSIALFAQQAEIHLGLYMDESGNEGTLEVLYIFPEGYHQTLTEDFFHFTVETDGVDFGEVQYPDGGIEEDGFINYYGSALLKRDFRLQQDNMDDFQWEVTAAYQLCDDWGVCLLPQQENITVSSEEASLLEGGGTSSVKNENKSWFFYLILALVGGILLNLMPCVLPLLSVKALNLVHQSDKDRQSILIHSWLYALGILVSMWILSLLVSVIQASGTLLGWGFQFQSPWFVLILISVILVFAYSLFDLYYINPPGIVSTGKRSGYGGSFLTGTFAVLVATPCTAPFMGTALGFAFSQPPWITFILFSALGLGFAFPFILLGFFPSVIKKLPKPGPWMNVFKEIMGFLLLGTAVYLLSTLNRQIGSSIEGVYWFLLLLTFSVWLFGIFQKPSVKKAVRIAGWSAALLIVLLSGWMLLDLNPQPTRTELNSDADKWTFSPEEVTAIREQNIPLFLEFTADWCTTCKVNHKRVLDTDFKKDLFEDLGIRHMVGDFTLADETIAEWLQRYGRAGVPLYIYFPPGGDEILLPEILTKELLQDTVDPQG